uniref:Transmembrane protein 223 n=1 Tax=Zosterops lateralis melanops TaxID=1220523 RepID=A0A8D2NIY4_ZOSLA
MAARAALEAAAISRDVILYEHDRSRFFRLLGLFCTGQGLFWTYLAHFAFTSLRPAPGPGPEDPLRPRDNKWRFGFTASCLTVGTGGDRWGPGTHLRTAGDTLDTPGTHLGHTWDTPGAHLGTPGDAPGVSVTVPIKVRGRPFFFLLDKRGQFRHPRLFDLTAGAFRGF